jgi:phage shock protein A
MQTLAEKFRVWTLGNVHSLLDKQMAKQPIPVVEQHVRDLGEALGNIRRQSAIAKSHVDSAKSEIGMIQQHSQEFKDGARYLLTDEDTDNDKDADPLLAKAIECDTDADTKRQQLVGLTSEADDLAAMAQKIDGKYKEAVAQLRDLRSQEQRTVAKERSAKAVTAATEALNIADSASTDSLARGLRDREAAANSDLETAMGAISDTATEALAKVNAQKRMDELRASLKSKPAAAG